MSAPYRYPLGKVAFGQAEPDESSTIATSTSVTEVRPLVDAEIKSARMTADRAAIPEADRAAFLLGWMAKAAHLDKLT